MSSTLADLAVNITEKVVGTNKDPDRPYVGLEHLITDRPRIAGSALASTSVSVNTVFRAGDTLFGKLRPNLRKVALAAFDGYCSTDILVLRAANGNSEEFLSHQLRSRPVLDFAAGTAFGTKMPRTSWSLLQKLTVFAPPLPEQRRIAEILDTLDDQIHATEQIIAKLELSKDGIVDALLTQGIETSGNIRGSGLGNLGQFRQTELGMRPESWRIGQLINFCKLQRGFDITVSEQRSGSFPVISSSGIKSYHDRPMVAGPGVVTGRKGMLGNVYFSKGDFWPHDTTLWVTDFCGNSPRFIALLLRNMRLERLDAATSVPTLNRNSVHPLLVAVPPYVEQLAIVDKVEAFQTRIDLEYQTLGKLRSMKTGLGADLLTGRIRVPEEAAS